MHNKLAPFQGANGRRALQSVREATRCKTNQMLIIEEHLERAAVGIVEIASFCGFKIFKLTQRF